MTLKVTFLLNDGRKYTTEYGCDAKGVKKILGVELLYDNTKPKLKYKPHKLNNKGDL